MANTVINNFIIGKNYYVIGSEKELHYWPVYTTFRKRATMFNLKAHSSPWLSLNLWLHPRLTFPEQNKQQFALIINWQKPLENHSAWIRAQGGLIAGNPEQGIGGVWDSRQRCRWWGKGKQTMSGSGKMKHNCTIIHNNVKDTGQMGLQSTCRSSRSWEQIQRCVSLHFPQIWYPGSVPLHINQHLHGRPADTHWDACPKLRVTLTTA